MTIANVITLGIGPGSAVKYLLTGGLDLGAAVETGPVSRKLVRGRRRRRVVENSQEIAPPVVVAQEVVAPPPLDLDVGELDLSALEERADHLEALLEARREAERIAELKADAEAQLGAMRAEREALEAELRRVERRIRDERDILAILALAD